MGNLYFLGGDFSYVEMLDAAQAAMVLAGLRAAANRTTDPAVARDLARQIAEINEWVDQLAEEAAAAAVEDAAAEHAAALFADRMLGL
jgi:hypothetical protein